jgi:hypothetical protein
MYELKKSFGAIVNGKHELWAAGSTFSAGEDDEVIGFLARSGAVIEPVAPKVRKTKAE